MVDEIKKKIKLSSTDDTCREGYAYKLLVLTPRVALMTKCYWGEKGTVVWLRKGNPRFSHNRS